MDRNLRLTLAYDGAGFHGWQRQPDLRTVQEAVEETLRHLLLHPLVVQGASRTDSGVHARGQVANVLTSSSIPLDNLRRAIGHHLPADIALVHIREAPPDFDASRDACGKLYRYRLYNAVERPVGELLGRQAWHIWWPLDDERLWAAGRAMVGTHDFAGFQTQGNPRPSTVRTIRRVEILRVGREVWIDVEGDGFLYNQVRNMVGTLIEIGRGHWPVERIGEILATRSRSLAGPIAPAHGLCLQWVRYHAT
jgi:tRNA pseudouridine38-40 synthase